MPHIQVEATTDQLLGAVAQLPADELVAFVQRVLMLRAERVAPPLAADETALLLRVNQPVPEPLHDRFDALVARRRDGTLTTEEHAELLRLTDVIEQGDAARVTALTELAHLRRMPVRDLMHALAIDPSLDG